MTAKHTPGPWTLGEAEHGDLGYTGHGIYAARPGGEPWETVWLGQAHGVHVRVPLEYVEANARLLAAAPDMLQALCELVAEADEHPGWEGHPHAHTVGFEMARAAIAKATGDTA